MRTVLAVLLGISVALIARTAAAQTEADRTTASRAAVREHGRRDGLLQIDDDLHRFLDRQRTLGRLPHAHLTHKPLSAYEAGRYLDSLDSEPRRPTARRFGPFYGSGGDLWSATGEDYAIQINPLLYLSYGRAQRSGGTDRPTWRNTRGIRASGRVGSHIFFEARVEETQERLAATHFDRITAPRRPFVRVYADSTGYDYQVGTGIIGFLSEHFEVRFGRDRAFWGFGEESIMLSDYAPVYDQLQIRTTFWRLQYVNLFAGFSDVSPSGFIPPNVAIPRKYGAFHHLEVNISPRVSVSVFESVIFGPDSSSGRRDGFDPAYLNPVVFYRTIEADRGSPDNILVGLGGSWIATVGLRLYAQLLFDEFVVSKLFTDSWTNRWGMLLGAHVVPLESLSLRAEFARLRPFLYTHRNSTTSYLHYLDALGHPAGPNALDYSFFADWRPGPRWNVSMAIALTRFGRSRAGTYIGDDPRRSFNERDSDRVPMLAGAKGRRLLIELNGGYELLPRLHMEVAVRIEELDDLRYIEPFALLRWGLPFESVRY